MPAIKDNKFGGGGERLLGSNVGRQLLDSGAAQAVLIDNMALGTAVAVTDLLTDPRCTLLRGDMTTLHELMEPFRGAAGVFSVTGFLRGLMLANLAIG